MDTIMHSQQTKVRIAISDDSPFITDSIRHILNQDLADLSVEIYPSRNQALLDKLQAEPVDLLITDFNLTFDSSLGGIQKIQSICRKAAEARVIVLTSQQTVAILADLLKQPIRAIVSKTDERLEIIRALHHAISAHHGVYLSEKIRDLMGKNPPNSDKNALTCSELEVIRLFAMGYSLTEIAQHRKRSISTVATQKYNAMRKLKLSSNTDLIKYVYSQNML